MTFNAEQGLRAVVDKQRRVLSNDVIFQRNKIVNAKVE